MNWQLLVHFPKLCCPFTCVFHFEYVNFSFRFLKRISMILKYLNSKVFNSILFHFAIFFSYCISCSFSNERQVYCQLARCVCSHACVISLHLCKFWQSKFIVWVYWFEYGKHRDSWATQWTFLHLPFCLIVSDWNVWGWC